MRHLLIVLTLVIGSITLNAQNLSFNCPRDTSLACNVNCLTLQGIIPNLRGAGNDYTFNNVTNTSSCRSYDPPQNPGPSANITADDRYSSIINLPFSFPFYGTFYNKVVACGNGYLSFDTTLANAFAAWDLSPGGTITNFPSDLYDRALIASPFHDLDPSSTNSPSRQIKYQTIGTAPNRVWVLSYFRVPLYGTGCDAQIENTHQIALHESTGMIEVFIKDKQICNSWNDGRAMVGLQDYTRTKAIMPPGRRATDQPWGTVGMNEVWRFYPKLGAPLFKKVELLDENGAVLQTNTDTTRISNDLFQVSFPNVCPTSGNSMYVIRTTYGQISNPNATIFNLDTVYITQITSLPVTASTTPTSCGSTNGTITVNVSAGIQPFKFSLNGAAPQTSNVFNNLTAGIYNISVTDSVNCVGTITVFVDSSSLLNASFIATGATCSNRTDGKVTLTPNGGLPPFTYTLNNGPISQSPQTANGPLTWSNLPYGNYSFNVRDSLGCNVNLNNIYVDSGSSLIAQYMSTPVCGNSNNGTIRITPVNGISPYQFSLNGGASTQQGLFTQLAAGIYTVNFTDSNGCQGTVTGINIRTAPALSGSASSSPASCAQSSDGQITVTPVGGSPLYFIELLNSNDSVIAQTSINSFASVRPGTYQVRITDSLGCTNSSPISVTVGANTVTGGDTTITACDSFVWNNTVYTTSGTYTASMVSPQGCPYVNTLRLTINRGTFGSVTETACEIFNWNGRVYTSSGMYIYQYSNANGCASYDTLFLTINRGTRLSTTQSACGSYTWNGTTYTVSGTYIQTSTNADGCTNIDTLRLTINEGTFQSSTVSSCDTYNWNGNTYTANGTYLRNYNNANGCASTDTLYLTIQNSSTTTITATVCDSYLWNGTVYTNSGTYTYNGTNSAGCDSIATLNLTINNAEQNSFDTTACNSFTWNGTTYTTSGTYTYNGTNAAGCDSTVTVNLTIDLACRSWTCRIGTNPTSNYFDLNAISPDNQTPIGIRVFDMNGRILKSFTMPANSSRQVGQDFGNGIYFIEFIQGDNRSVIRGVKQF